MLKSGRKTKIYNAFFFRLGKFLYLCSQNVTILVKESLLVLI